MNDQPIILAVDDTPESLTLVVKILTLAGYQVRPADSGELALSAIAANPPDLILLDVRMLDMDGLEVCRRLKGREQTRHIPIILISAFADVKEWVKGLQLGAADYITKPFQPEELLTRVKTHLSLSRANISLEQQAAMLRQTNEQLQSEIVKRQRLEGELRALSLEDGLTSLCNRRGFVTLAGQQLKMALRTRRGMFLLFLDLDELKQINDVLGHSEGDAALLAIAHLLRETFREADILARLGGDEFAVLAEEMGESADILVARLQENLAAYNLHQNRSYTLSLSVGCARYDPDAPCPVEELLARADRLMYAEKRRKRKP